MDILERLEKGRCCEGELCGRRLLYRDQSCHDSIRRKEAADEIAKLRAANADMLSKLETIAKVTAPGARNLDQMCRDMDLACDYARAAITKARGTHPDYLT